MKRRLYRIVITLKTFITERLICIIYPASGVCRGIDNDRCISPFHLISPEESLLSVICL